MGARHISEGATMSRRLTAEQAIAAATREATASATRRAVEITTICLKHNAAAEMTAMILSGKPPGEVEAELKRKITAQGWDAAVAKVGGGQS